MSTPDTPTTGIDPGTFWRLMSMRPVGAAVVAASHSGMPAGLLALSVTHVAASPPTMLVCVGRSTSALATIKAAGSFAISYLPAGSHEIAEVFGGRRGLSGSDRFSVGQWTHLKTGAPVLANAVLALECRTSAVFVHEDTEIIVGRIEHCASSQAHAPLVAYRGSYRALALSDEQ